jgi:hypothetical protein
MARSASRTTHPKLFREGGGESGTRVSRFGTGTGWQSGGHLSVCDPRSERSFAPVVKASDVDDLVRFHAEHLPTLGLAAILLRLAGATHMESDQERSSTGDYLGDPGSGTRLPASAPPFEHLFATAAIRFLTIGCSPTRVRREQPCKRAEVGGVERDLYPLTQLL